MKAKRKVCNVDSFIQWGFQFFKCFSLYKDEEDFTSAFNSLISQQQFQLISKLMSRAKKFTSQEVIELFQFGDKFFVSGRAKEKIFSLFMNHLSSRKIENVHEMQRFHLWNDFINYLKQNSAVEVDKSSIKLNGLRVSFQKKDETFVLLRNLAPFYKVLYICDIPLFSNDLKVIHCDLTELHIERCPFNFEEQLDLSRLTRLTHFTCSSCFADCHLLFSLESLTSDLEYLDISNTWINPIDYSRLVAWIEKQKSLKHLNLFNNNLTPRSAPTIFNVLFNLPSLEILDLADNFLLYDFLKQLSSFPGSLNWKSLTINDCDKLWMDSDLFPSCFSKLKQLEYLDMSDILEQNFSSSLIKGISELINLKNFVFNSEAKQEYSKKIEKLYERNPNLELNLKKHTIKSFNDWELSISHPECKFDELIESENLENVSQLIYRHIYFRLNSSNNSPSQIENVITKLRGVERVKLYIIHDDYDNYGFFKSRKNFPRSIDFFIFYGNENDLQNVLFCCMKYLRPTLFYFQPLENSNDQLCEFMLETENSPYWESIKELALREYDIRSVIEIISETNLPNLKYLYLENVHSEYENDYYVWSGVKNHSLQFLSLKNKEYKTDDKLLRILFECFPNMTKLRIDFSCDLSNNFPISALPKGLRILDILTEKKIEYLDILNHLNSFPLLKDLKLLNRSHETFNLTLNKTICLPNLTNLTILQCIFNSATFMLPELRELTIRDINDSSLDNLKVFKKLKSIRLIYIDREITQKLIDSDFLFSFPNLNLFYCTLGENFNYKFNYDFVSDKISKTLICFNVGDSNNEYFGHNNNGKRLQVKRMPFLYMYGFDIV